MAVVHNPKDAEHHRLAAAMGYAGVLCFLPLIFKKNSAFAQWHAKQGLMLLIIEVIAFVLPLVLWPVFLLAVLFSLTGISQALHGKYWRLPFFSGLIEKLKL